MLRLVVPLLRLVALVLLDGSPHLVVSLDLDRLGGVEFLETTEIHWLFEKWEDVFVEGLPVSFWCQSGTFRWDWEYLRVRKMVLLALRNVSV